MGNTNAGEKELAVKKMLRKQTQNSENAAAEEQLRASREIKTISVEPLSLLNGQSPGRVPLPMKVTSWSGGTPEANRTAASPLER